jgi:hypothetical protein
MGSEAYTECTGGESAVIPAKAESSRGAVEMDPRWRGDDAALRARQFTLTLKRISKNGLPAPVAPAIVPFGRTLICVMAGSQPLAFATGA